jgi:GNAT superfamily N-acetyltransferase
VPIKTVAELRALLAAEPVGAALDGTPPLTAERVRAVLAADRPLGAEWRGPAFAFPANISGPTLGEEARVVLVDASNSGIAGSFGLAAADFPLALPCTTVLHRGEAAAVCHAARRTATAAEAGVRTLPGFRGRGFGAAAVAAWAGEARRLGLVPLYSCAWENAASRGVARRLGLRLYAEDWHIA